MIKTDKLWIGSMVRRADDASEMVQEFAGKMGVEGKQYQRMRLLVEETMGMAQTLLKHFEGEIWLEGTDNGYAVILEADVREHEESDVPSKTTPSGFMATIAEMLNCAYMFEDPDEMPEGLSGMLPEYISNGLGDGQPAQIWAGEWSMSAYKASLEQRKKENGDGIVLDELEKSIVAQIADEVTVGIHGRKVRLVISKAC